MLSVASISKSFGAAQVLKDVSLNVTGGTVHAVLGANGAGKSTLMKCIAGALAPDTGTITINGVTRATLNPQHSQQLGVAVVYQNLSLVSSLSVAENIFLGVEQTRLGFVRARAQRQAATAILAALGQTISPAVRVDDLPADARQMVEIAKAVAKSPKVLILDEPTAALSEAETVQLFAMIRDLRRSNIAIIYISHRIPEIFEIADDVTVLRDGQVALQSAAARTSAPEIIAAMLGSKGDNAPARSTARPFGDVVLAAEDLDAGFPAPLSFTVRRGEIVGLYGLTGSGREALVATVAGARRANGTLRVAGRRMRFTRPRHAIAAGVCLVPGDRLARGLFSGMLTIDNMLLPRLRQLGGIGRARRKELALYQQVAGQLGVVPASPNHQIGELSGGNQQKILLGRWIAEPSQLNLLILEEPTEGVDAGARRDLYANLRAAIEAHAFGILWSSSDLDELVAMADRVLVMASGQIVGEVTRATLSPDAILSLAQHTRAETA